MAEPIAGVGYLAGQCGYTGTDWQKLQMLWGYYDRWYENVEETTPVNGNEIFITPVDTNYVHVLQFYSMAQFDAVARTGSVRLMAGDVSCAMLYPTTSFESGVWYNGSPNVVLKEGDKVRFYVAGMAEGKAIKLLVWGYKMRLDL